VHKEYKSEDMMLEFEGREKSHEGNFHSALAFPFS